MRRTRGSRVAIPSGLEVMRRLTRRVFLGRVVATSLSVVAIRPGGRALADAGTARSDAAGAGEDLQAVFRTIETSSMTGGSAVVRPGEGGDREGSHEGGNPVARRARRQPVRREPGERA